ncbi:MAG: hypothetical protein HYS13_22870 [Planctomycetia bacterium]|nr:hypothetical protein [Planctomycetia bacterium]
MLEKLEHEQLLELRQLGKAQAGCARNHVVQVDCFLDLRVPRLVEASPPQGRTWRSKMQHDVHSARPANRRVELLGAAVGSEQEHDALAGLKAVQLRQQARAVARLGVGVPAQVEVVEEHHARPIERKKPLDAVRLDGVLEVLDAHGAPGEAVPHAQRVEPAAGHGLAVAGRAQEENPPLLRHAEPPQRLAAMAKKPQRVVEQELAVGVRHDGGRRLQFPPLRATQVAIEPPHGAFGNRPEGIQLVRQIQTARRYDAHHPQQAAGVFNPVSLQPEDHFAIARPRTELDERPRRRHAAASFEPRVTAEQPFQVEAQAQGDGRAAQGLARLLQEEVVIALVVGQLHIRQTRKNRAGFAASGTPLAGRRLVRIDSGCRRVADSFGGDILGGGRAVEGVEPLTVKYSSRNRTRTRSLCGRIEYDDDYETSE